MSAVITAKKITKTIGTRDLLSEVSFTITKESLVALIGPNGAGKSTLIKIIAGLDTTYSGTVDIAPGETMEYISQQVDNDTFGLPISVYEYLRIGLANRLTRTPVKKQVLIEALEHVGLESNIITQDFSSLSGGERQRAAIARALLSEPTILILDEPLAAVDYGSREDMYQLIRHLQQSHNMTVLLVSHDVQSVIPISDEVLCLNKSIRNGCHPLSFAQDGDTHDTVHHHC